ncbi:hypothetical protein E2I00_004343 [Balaenoptera physalus]|uniref:Uncharacterized protein n=1 Tax=Balaenoptera physalus TaxID=9770 RepID=A0A6A1QFR9_BALPH|nr:hypothetical protein E2I00_004343 [Balaenoptera physalus]
MGVIGGGVFQAIKGFRNAPVGIRHRMRGSVNAVRIRAPQIGGERFGETDQFRNGEFLVKLARERWEMHCLASSAHLYPILPAPAPPFLEDPSQLPPKEGTPAPGYPSYQQYH